MEKALLTYKKVYCKADGIIDSKGAVKFLCSLWNRRTKQEQDDEWHY